MAINPQKQAAKKFVEYWTFNRPGSEKSGSDWAKVASAPLTDNTVSNKRGTVKSDLEVVFGVYAKLMRGVVKVV